MAKLVSRVYGEALFEVAVDDNIMDSLIDEAEVVLDILSENEDYIKLLNHPKISDQEKNTLIKSAFEGKVCEDFLNFMITVVEKGRFGEIESILKYFLDAAREYKKIGTAYVTTATEISDEEKASIEKRLLETTKYESFRMNYSVDKGLIGGMTIKIGDRVVDSSIRTELANMAKNLSKIQLTNN